MAGYCIFTAGSIRSNIGKMGKPPEGNTKVMDVLSLTPNGVYYSVSMYMCVLTCALNHGCAKASDTPWCSELQELI